MLEKLKKLQSRQFDSGTALRKSITEDLEFRTDIQILYKHYYNEEVTGCSDCLTDAFFRLKSLKKENMERKYRIRKGALIYDPINRDASLIMTDNNCTDLLAEYHLLANPDCSKYFVDLHENFESKLKEKYKGGAKEVLAILKGETKVDKVIEEKKTTLKKQSKKADEDVVPEHEPEHEQNHYPKAEPENFVIE